MTLIISNQKDETVIIYALKDNYHKLAGGGIEAGENPHLAGSREAKEETGCEANVEGECMAITEVEEIPDPLQTPL